MQSDPAIWRFQRGGQHPGVMIAGIVEENVDHALIGISRLQLFQQAECRFRGDTLAFESGQL